MTLTLEWLPWLPVACYASGALAAAGLGSPGWRVLGVATRAALAASLCAGAIIWRSPGPELAATTAATIVATLIAFLGWIIGDYSRRYLQGEPGQRRFVVAYLATLAAVSAVVASRNLAVLIVAWAASSAGLHHLLTYYRNRPAAVIVAHKKFLASRLAELLLLAAASLLYLEWGTLDIPTLLQLASVSGLPASAATAAVLIAAAVLLKSAQLPLHGWLIQVMEAPTPVSALLHAGVVNLGGFVLILLAPLMSASSAAQALLVIVGCITAALAGLVMLTRVTIKVRLAWSTCSQMGFMMLECGLGLYDLALLHLVAHGLYKAHAFLSAGDAVRNALERQYAASSTRDAAGTSWASALIALPISALITLGSAQLWHAVIGLPPVPWIATVLLAFGLATLLWSPAGARRSATAGLLRVMAAAQLYFVWHWLLTAQAGVVVGEPLPWLEWFAVAVFSVLYLAQAWLCMPRGAASRPGLYDWAYSGLYLDERYTRLTFQLWPARTDSVGHRAGTAAASSPNRSQP